MTADAIALVERACADLDADPIDPFLDHFAPDGMVVYPAEGRLPYGGRWEGRGGMTRRLLGHVCGASPGIGGPPGGCPTGR